MAIYRLTATRDMCSGKLKKGTSCTVSVTGTRKPQFHEIKKALAITTSSTPVVNDNNFIIEQIG
jgi:hypothetical protein